MKKKTPKCPYCNHDLNLGSIMAQTRWDNKTKQEKLEQGKILTKSRLEKGK